MSFIGRNLLSLNYWTRLPIGCLVYPVFLSAYGRLSVRSLLNVREHLLNELYFPDPYINMKRRENEYFLQHLPTRNVVPLSPRAGIPRFHCLNIQVND